MEGIPDVLATKDPSVFRNHPVNVRYVGDTVHLTVLPEEQTFPEMLAQRKKAQDPSALEAALHSDDGYTVANVGVSALMQLEYNSNHYLVTVRADRVDRAVPDTVAKLLSGYVPADKMLDPEQHLRREIAEELLPMVDGKLVPLRDYNLTRKNRYDLPFLDVLPYSDSTLRRVDLDMRVKISSDFERYLPGIKNAGIVIKNDRHQVVSSSPAMSTYFQIAADTNSGQLIFPFALYLVNSAIGSAPRWSLHHSEDKFNPATKQLDVKFHPEGILLLECTEPPSRTEHLDKLGLRYNTPAKIPLTSRAFTLGDGQLKPYDKPVMLTEAFVPKKNGISSLGNISLEEYVRGYEEFQIS